MNTTIKYCLVHVLNDIFSFITIFVHYIVHFIFSNILLQAVIGFSNKICKTIEFYQPFISYNFFLIIDANSN